MIISIYILLQIAVIGFFIAAFYTKQEILWSITLILSGVLMFTAFDVGHYTYEFNQTISAYQPIIQSNSFPYLMGINMIFFGLSVLLGMFDLFDKYGITMFKGDKDQ